MRRADPAPSCARSRRPSSHRLRVSRRAPGRRRLRSAAQRRIPAASSLQRARRVAGVPRADASPRRSDGPGRPGLGPWVTLGGFLVTRPTPSARDRPAHAGVAGGAVDSARGTGFAAHGIVERLAPAASGYRQDRFLADLAAPSRTIRAATTPTGSHTRPASAAHRFRAPDLQGFPPGWTSWARAPHGFGRSAERDPGHVADRPGAACWRTPTGRARRRRDESAPWPREFHGASLHRLRACRERPRFTGRRRAAVDKARSGCAQAPRRCLDLGGTARAP